MIRANLSNLFDPEPLEVDADDINPEQCGLCGGPGLRMGCLGALVWHRCRQCGAEFSTLNLEAGNG